MSETRTDISTRKLRECFEGLEFDNSGDEILAAARLLGAALIFHIGEWPMVHLNAALIEIYREKARRESN
jgi:hypothetical protein